MRRILERIENYQPRIDLSHPVFSRLDGIAGVKERPNPANIDMILERIGKKSEALAEDLKAICRMTLAPTIIHGGVKSNVIPSLCELTCNLRTLPGQDRDFVADEITRLLGGLRDVRFRVSERFSASTSSPFDTSFKDAIQYSIRQALRNENVTLFPFLMSGSSDSRLLRPYGTITYGFSPIHPAADKSTTGAHCPNECTDIRSLFLKTKMLLFLARNFNYD